MISCFSSVESLRECIQILRAANCIKLVKPRCEELWVRDAALNCLPQTGSTEYPMRQLSKKSEMLSRGPQSLQPGQEGQGTSTWKVSDITELPCERKAWCHYPCTGTHMPELVLNSPWEAKCWKAMWLPHSPLWVKCMNMMESWLTGWEPGVHTWLWWGDNTAFFRMLAAWEPSTLQCTVGPVLLAACQPQQCRQQALSRHWLLTGASSPSEDETCPSVALWSSLPLLTDSFSTLLCSRGLCQMPLWAPVDQMVSRFANLCFFLEKQWLGCILKLLLAWLEKDDHLEIHSGSGCLVGGSPQMNCWFAVLGFL